VVLVSLVVHIYNLLKQISSRAHLVEVCKVCEFVRLSIGLMFLMNSKKIRSHECSFRSLSNAHFQFLNASCGNCSSKEIWSTGPPLHCPRKNNSDSFESFVSSEEASPPSNLMPPNISDAGVRCVGSTPAAFYAAERLMGFPHFEDQFDTLPLFSQSAKDLEIPPFRHPEVQLSMDLKKQNDTGTCSRDTLESLLKFPMQKNYNSMVFNDTHRFAHGNPQNCIVSILLAYFYIVSILLSSLSYFSLTDVNFISSSLYA